MELTLLTLLFLAFFQLISDLIQSTYTFGLLGVDIPPEIVFVLFLLAPVLLLAFPLVLEGKTARSFALVTGLAALACRAASLALDTRGKMIFAGLGTGLMLLCLPALLRQTRRGAAALTLGAGLAFASLAAMLLRAAYFGSDVISVGRYVLTGWALALFAAYLLVGWSGWPSEPAAATTSAAPAWSAWRWLGVCLGLFSALLLILFGFASPTVISRWTGASYPLITLLLAGSLALTAGLWLRSVRFKAALTPRVLLAWNVLFLIALVITLRAHSIDFPAAPAAYPLDAPIHGQWTDVTLGLMLLLHPVLYLDFGLLGQMLVDAPPSPRKLAGGMAAAALYLTVLIFAQVFTTVYDYIPVIGPLFRDRFWLVTSLPALLLALSMLLARPSLVPGAPWRINAKPARIQVMVYAMLLAAGALTLSLLLDAHPIPPASDLPLRVLTYNIQQGATAEGQNGFDAQLEVIRRMNPSVLGLQESDTARLAGGNADVVRYFAGRLNMYAYYGPKSATGTFGIALLSRSPIQNPRTFFMYSSGEQTAAIEAEINANGKTYTVLVTHLGNDGPIIQQQQVLERLAGRQNIIAMGDFNFRPDTPQYAITTAALDDAWVHAAAHQVDGGDVTRRIDHIFVSPGTRVINAEYLPRGPSDHPALFVEIGQ